jgi:gamma-glutamylputrescine oxidase
VRYPGTFGIIAYLYCQGLKEVLVKQGVEVYERSPVTKWNDHTVWTDKYQVTAKNIVFCADHCLPWLGIAQPDVYHAQTFLGLSTPLTKEQQRQLFPTERLMVWDTDLIYQYFRLTGEGRLLLGGSSVLYTYLKTEKHSPQRVIRKLQKYIQTKFPGLNVELEYLWPGLIGVSKDFLPVAGQHKQWPHVYYVGGSAGLPWAAALGRHIAARLVAEKSSVLDQYFATPRHYPVGYSLQKILGKPLTFALSHGIRKYFK